jgi:hypothetical protein
VFFDKGTKTGTNKLHSPLIFPGFEEKPAQIRDGTQAAYDYLANAAVFAFRGSKLDEWTSMEIRTRPQTQGNVLLATLLIAAIISLALGSYLTLTSNQNLATFRSMTFNRGIAVAEAGIEEALTQIHYTGIAPLSVTDWTLGTDGCYHKKRIIDTDGAYYDVALKLVDPPVIVSTAYVPAPLAASSTFGMVLGTVTSGGTANSYVKRRIRVNTVADSASGAAVVSNGPIYLSGNNVTIDSFDSTNPLYSTNGMYLPSLSRDHGDVLTNARDGLTSNGKPLYALDVGDADIKGHVTTGPGGTVHLTAGGSVGDSAWVNVGTPGIESGWNANNANMDITNVDPPFTNGYFTPVPITIGKVKYTYYLPESANYKLSTLSGKVLVTGNATLWVTDDVNIGSGEFIELAPGASLKLYVSAPSAVIGGSGIINSDGYAKNFQYYGLPTNTSINYKGNSSFTGTINAPQADLKLGGGGTTDYDYIGSCVVNTLTMNGHFHIHYDEALRPNVSNGYLVSSWNEVDPNTP